MKKKETQSVIRVFAKQYKNASKKKKTAILTQLEQTVGYHRKYLIYSLSHPHRRRRIIRKRASKYLLVQKPLKKLWAVSNYSCGQRLKPMIRTYLAALRRHNELIVSKEERKLLLEISSSTIDRFLKQDRRRINLKSKSRTKPGTLLKHQIPIKTWADWDNTVPGFLEIDSVHHCDSNASGDFIYTLDTTDVSTGWNECCAHLGRGERRTVRALEAIRRRLPFNLLGIDFDTGGEFVNYHLVRYCKRNQITYTRARESVKNDQCYVEQQNYSIVRRFVGYQRLDTWEQLNTLNTLYGKLSNYQNFFQPVMRLKTKARDGARVTRTYDRAQTAYQRILKRKDTSSEKKEELRERFKELNPKKLLLEITDLGRKLSGP